MGAQTQLRFAGTGGQGLQLSARILAEALLRDGRVVALSQSYEPTSRGGVSRSDLVISDGAIDFPLVSALDRLIVLDQLALPSSLPLVSPGGLILADADRVGDLPAAGFTVEALPFTAAARSLGSERVANAVALGALVQLGGLVPRGCLEEVLREETPPKFLDLNLAAFAAGCRLAGDRQPVLPTA
jgi:2-oxoglutarate ferredoxin oxidoreductase subunit gamma